PAAWFAEYQLEPLARRRRVVRLAGPSRYISPIHVEDCARALLHLLEHGAAGARYFVVDDDPGRASRLIHEAAAALDVPARTLPLPEFLCRWALGPIVTESLTCDCRLDNARLKALGFTL